MTYILDLFCNAGGAAEGYRRAGFDVIGVDIDPQPNYPFRFVQDDWREALALLIPMVDAVHASPPCQHYSKATPDGHRDNHPDLVGIVVQHLIDLDVPWVVENVPGSPIDPDFLLCGSMFDLGIRRHRYFLTSWHGLELVPQCQHRRTDLAFSHGSEWWKGTETDYSHRMGIDWMTVAESREAIPPAYTEWIGRRLMEQIR